MRSTIFLSAVPFICTQFEVHSNQSSRTVFYKRISVSVHVVWSLFQSKQILDFREQSGYTTRFSVLLQVLLEYRKIEVNKFRVLGVHRIHLKKYRYIYSILCKDIYKENVQFYGLRNLNLLHFNGMYKLIMPAGCSIHHSLVSANWRLLQKI